MHSIRTYVPLLFILAVNLLFHGCDKEENPPEPYGIVHGFVISTTGDKLLATNDGLYVFNDGKGKFELADNGSLASPYFDLAYSNTKQELWLASHSGAINSYTLEFLDARKVMLAEEAKHVTYYKQSDLPGYAVIKIDEGKESMMLEYYAAFGEKPFDIIDLTSLLIP